jgi:type I restriction enzyme S subunit
VSSWPLVALGDVFEIARGGSPRPIDEYITDEADGLNWITISDASEGSKYITRTKRRIRRDGAKRSRMVQPGDFLLTNSMSFGRPYIMRTSGCIHDGWLVLTRKAENVDSDFFFHLLGSKAVYLEFERRAAGVTVKNLNIELVKGVRVILPPLREQRRIAEVLDRADALRAKRRAAVAQLDTLTRSIFLEMFGDPAGNPKGWQRVPFSQLLVKIDSGWSPTCLDRPSSGGEWGVLKLGAVTWCEYDPTENKALPTDVEPVLELEVRPGDLLFARKNTYELVAACAFVRATPPRLLIPDLIFRFQLRPDADMDTTFLHQLLIFPTKRREIQRLAGGSAGSMPNISKKRLETALIETPPLRLQREFAARVAAIDKIKATYRASLAHLDVLFASLQHCAFRGDLWPTAPQPPDESQADVVRA